MPHQPKHEFYFSWMETKHALLFFLSLKKIIYIYSPYCDVSQTGEKIEASCRSLPEVFEVWGMYSFHYCELITPTECNLIFYSACAAFSTPSPPKATLKYIWINIYGCIRADICGAKLFVYAIESIIRIRR